MNFYKKLIKSRKLRFRILSLFRIVPDKTMVSVQYRIKCGRKLNLKNPKRYSEKLQWYKLYYRDPLMQKCADKYRVREYIESKGLGYILNDLLAVFETPEDICLDQLPDRFVLKLSNGSATNLICTDKSKLDLATVKKQFGDYIRQANTSAGREWVYASDEKPVIIAEKFLEDAQSAKAGIADYKFFCFGGEPHVIGYYAGRFDHLTRDFYTVDWVRRDVTGDYPNSTSPCPKPQQLEQMLEISRILSSDFPHVRVDLYLVNDKIYFGELTYFNASGYMKYQPDSFDFELGEKFVLPERNH